MSWYPYVSAPCRACHAEAGVPCRRPNGDVRPAHFHRRWLIEQRTARRLRQMRRRKR